MLADFSKFARRGNFVDLAVGFTVGAAFSTIAKSLVNDVLMPPIGLLIGRTDFTDLFWVLRSGPKADGPYVTLADAQAAGAVTLNYGVFVNSLVAFFVVALAMFFIIRMIQRAEERLDGMLDDGAPPPEEPLEKKCPYCRSTIAFRATRCPHCTSQLDTACAPKSDECAHNDPQDLKKGAHT
ncbi:large-conductance mechanosensitive channel protein MscL [Hydrogenophaga sp. 5NK40-0174]